MIERKMNEVRLEDQVWLTEAFGGRHDSGQRLLLSYFSGGRTVFYLGSPWDPVSDFVWESWKLQDDKEVRV